MVGMLAVRHMAIVGMSGSRADTCTSHPYRGEPEAESAVAASLSGWGGREVTDLGVKLDFATKGRVAGLLHVAHQARALRLKAPRVLVHILRRAERSALNSEAGHSMLDATSTSNIIIITAWTTTRWDEDIPYPVRGTASIQTRMHRLEAEPQRSPRHGGRRALWLRPAAAPHP